MDEYSTIQGKNQFDLLTGKPLVVGNSLIAATILPRKRDSTP
jgi:glutamate dehydrogenase/leucine dehydrogenase